MQNEVSSNVAARDRLQRIQLANSGSVKGNMSIESITKKDTTENIISRRKELEVRAAKIREENKAIKLAFRSLQADCPHAHTHSYPNGAVVCSDCFGYVR